jgi:hypothetical protein
MPKNSEINDEEKELQYQFNAFATAHGADSAILNLINPELTSAYSACRAQIPEKHRMSVVKFIWTRLEEAAQIQLQDDSTDIEDFKEYALEINFLTDFDWDRIPIGTQDEELLRTLFKLEVKEVLRFSETPGEIEREKEQLANLLNSIRTKGFKDSDLSNLLDCGIND